MSTSRAGKKTKPPPRIDPGLNGFCGGVELFADQNFGPGLGLFIRETIRKAMEARGLNFVEPVITSARENPIQEVSTMAGSGAAKAKTPIEVTDKMALNYVREAIINFHPKAGELKTLSADVKIKKTSDGMLLQWGDEKFAIAVESA